MSRRFVPAAIAVLFIAGGALLAMAHEVSAAPVLHGSAIALIPYTSEADCESYEGKGKCSKCPIGTGDPGWHTTSSCGSITRLPPTSDKVRVLVKDVNSAEATKAVVHLTARKNCTTDHGTWMERNSELGCWLTEAVSKAQAGTAKNLNYKQRCLDRHGIWKENPKGEWGCWFTVK